MSYYKKPILHLEEGLERELMTLFLKQIKQTKGLTTALDQKGGINGKWLKPDEPYNIFIKNFLKIVFIKTIIQEPDELMDDLVKFTNEIYELRDKYAANLHQL